MSDNHNFSELSPNLRDPSTLRLKKEINTEVVVIGSGPAGLSAALSAAEEGAQVLLLERDPFLGGQLVKQTHMFFGSEEQYAAERGVKIGKILSEQLQSYDNIDVYINATALGYYEYGTLLVEHNGEIIRIKPSKMIVATGAQEKVLHFPNWDLPGVYGAGAVQTLMNVYGVKPGDKVVMVGAGNIGVIVSYQLIQAGVEVVGVLEAASQIGAYLVHASKLRRQGVPIYTSTTVKEVHGENALEKITTVELDNNWNYIPGSEQNFEVDVLCLSVGLTPLAELLLQAGCETVYVPELGGFTPIRDENFETTKSGIYVAGDVSGVEEASSAMVEGKLAGMFAAESLGYQKEGFWIRAKNAREELMSLRRGPVGQVIRRGQSQLVKKAKAKGV
ncbi:NAD(P)/FAD-dependent oxidoreductase [Natranaerobius thermophilus]|uniref:NAD(P)/FAD-dependent oxidoreductase n=1 Tax=Natranaerobius thermophilus TaxID=375929 RepID=UPI0001666E30|nr:NAD(P)/FAD-dependent oxidoreductase [Natranaerobius thermophilus]